MQRIWINGANSTLVNYIPTPMERVIRQRVHITWYPALIYVIALYGTLHLFDFLSWKLVLFVQVMVPIALWGHTNRFSEAFKFGLTHFLVLMPFIIISVWDNLTPIAARMGRAYSAMEEHVVKSPCSRRIQ